MLDPLVWFARDIDLVNDLREPQTCAESQGEGEAVPGMLSCS